MSAMNDEEALVRSFVVAKKRARMLGLLSNSKRRTKATRELAHFRDLDPRWRVPLPSTSNDADSIEKALRARGAGDSCYLVSESSELDGRRLPLRSALEQVIGRGMGTLVSCVPGEVAFFEGEEPFNRCILVRRATR